MSDRKRRQNLSLNPVLLCAAVALLMGLGGLCTQGAITPLLNSMRQSAVAVLKQMIPGWGSPASAPSGLSQASSQVMREEGGLLSGVKGLSGGESAEATKMAALAASEASMATTKTEVARLAMLQTPTPEGDASLQEDSQTPQPTLQAEPSATSADVTETPIPTQTSRATPTSTPTGVMRTLRISSSEVVPGETFTIEAICDDLEGIAGCDLSIEFPPGLIQVLSIDKTEITDSFLLVKRKADGGIVVSLAGVDGLPPGPGAILSMAATLSSSPGDVTSIPIRLVGAKMYDQDSHTAPVSSRDGVVTVIDLKKAEATPIQTAALSEPTTIPTTQKAAEPTQASQSSQQPTASYENPPVAYPTPMPPYVGGGGYYIEPTLTSVPPTLTPVPRAPTATPPAQAKLVAADVNGDGKVDHLDLFSMLIYWRDQK